jgi:large subunit ribosomal protein L30
MLAVIRIRGSTGVKPRAKKTGELLRLHKINHMVFLEDTPVTRGMLHAFKDYATWGEIDAETLELALKYRSMVQGHKRLTEEMIKQLAGVSSYSELAQAIMDGKVKYGNLEGVVPVLRLHPPRKGLEYIRRPYGAGGTLGYRGKEINSLIKRMLIPGEDLNGKNQN